VLALTAVAFAGCSGGPDDAADGPLRATPSPAASSSGAVGPAADVRRQIAAAHQAYVRSYLAALAAPGDPARVDDLLGRYTPSAKPAAVVRERMSSFAQRGFAGRAGAGGYHVVETVDDVGLPPHGRAVETSCGYDDSIVYDARHKAPDGGEILVDDTPTSVRTRITWVQRDGWKIDQVEALETWYGENRCPPRPGS
jgi:hypothetical protein